MVRHGIHDPAFPCLYVSRLPSFVSRSTSTNSIDLGMTSEEPELLKFALEQFAGESASLLDKPTNLYRHITAIDEKNSWDPLIWATGNGWMTYGLTRVVSSPPGVSSMVSVYRLRYRAACVSQGYRDRCGFFRSSRAASSRVGQRFRRTFRRARRKSICTLFITPETLALTFISMRTSCQTT